MASRVAALASEAATGGIDNADRPLPAAPRSRRRLVTVVVGLALAGAIAAPALADVHEVPGALGYPVARVATEGEDAPEYYGHQPLVSVNTNGGEADGWIAVANSGNGGGVLVGVSSDGGTPSGYLAVAHDGDAAGRVAVTDTGNASYGDIAAASGTGSATGNVATSATGHARGYAVAMSGAGTAQGDTVAVAGGGATGGIAVAGTGDAHSTGLACAAVAADCYGGSVIGLSVLGRAHA